MHKSQHVLPVLGVLVLSYLGSGVAAAKSQDSEQDPDSRASAIERQMTDDERFQLLHGIMPISFPEIKGALPLPPGLKITAGYVNGVARLGIPDIYETDASLGVANPFQFRKGDYATAMPSNLLLASTFSPAMAFESGQVIGNEARNKGFNILLAGGVNLARDPRSGRNFEYFGEDPLLAGTLDGEAIRGVQSEHIVSTVKHFALNDQETLRTSVDAKIAEDPFRESDLLAFELAIERGKPGAVMCAYNKVNTQYACGNAHLLNGVLKTQWKFPGWVMSDWGSVHDVAYFDNGLDQESGSQVDEQVFFDIPLKQAVAAGQVSRARLSDAVRRILRSLYAIGADAPLAEHTIDYAAHAEQVGKIAASGIVLLKNEGNILPLEGMKSIAVIGGYANIGVMSGGGSSQVTPAGPFALVPIGGRGILGNYASQLIVPSSPLKALKTALPGSQIEFDNGYVPEEAAAFAAHSDMAIVFVTQWQTEGSDASLTLPSGQDRLIEAVAKANPNTIVVLETGGPVKMPWADQVHAIVEAWYPGERGGEAISDVLTGKVSPSGRLPISFPVDEQQLVRQDIPGLGLPEGSKASITYDEGADVGYRRYATIGQKPLFPFGHGLTYARFSYTNFSVSDGTHVHAQLTVTNVGTRRAADVPQVYLTRQAGKNLERLVAFDRVELAPGETRSMSLPIDARLLANWQHGGWVVPQGRYEFRLGRSADDLDAAASTDLRAENPPDYAPH